MFNTLRAATLSALLAALLGLGGLASTPAVADAAPNVSGLDITVQINHGGRHHVRPLPQRYRGCTPARAQNKAERMGVRHARVRNVNRNVINVRGRDRRGPVVVTFARAAGCPVIRAR